MFKWPWVSRERFDEVQARCLMLEAERAVLVRELTGVRVPIVRPESTQADAREEREIDSQLRPTEPAEASSTDNPSFDTPFDRIGRRFDRAARTRGSIEKFRARIT